MPKYKVEVNTAGDPPGAFTGNAIEHDTQDDAIEAAKDLFMRWFAVEKWRVVTTDGEVVANGP